LIQINFTLGDGVYNFWPIMAGEEVMLVPKLAALLALIGLILLFLSAFLARHNGTCPI
jgi:hypothetical protein